MPHERRDAAAARVLQAVTRTLADERGRWLLRASHRDAQSELALTGVLDRDLVNVVIDRTFVDDIGTRWIVDYKTSSHEGAGLDEFLNRERERYQAQLERYARIVRAIEGPYRELLAEGTGERPLGRRFVDDAKVTDHHAIIPTATPPTAGSTTPT